MCLLNFQSILPCLRFRINIHPNIKISFRFQQSFSTFLEKIAEALAVNPEVLANSDFDGIKAIHRLFQIFRQYDGSLFEYQDKDGNDMVGISFGTLSLMQSWLERYEKYMDEVEKYL